MNAGWYLNLTEKLWRLQRGAIVTIDRLEKSGKKIILIPLLSSNGKLRSGAKSLPTSEESETKEFSSSN